MKHTKIELDKLFSTQWDSAYLIHHAKEGRNYVVLRNSATDKRTTIQYAKYLMSIKLGRILRREEQVDHIDGDKTNDSIDNLQLLSEQAHRAKTAVEAADRAKLRRLSRTPKHGTYLEHKKYGCNCEACVAAYREYSRRKTNEYRERLRLAGLKRKS